jgi:histidinol-phosphatase
MARITRTGSLLQAVAEVASCAGKTALRSWRRSLTVEQKPDGSPVTVADRAAERAARSWITKRFPGDGILGEEFGETRGTTGRRWVIDPIDGTRTFLRGVPLWGSLVAVMEGDTILAGAASFPAVGEDLAAAPGEGCWYRGARCTVSKVSRLEDATVLTTDEHGFTGRRSRRGWESLAETASLVRSWGDCYGYLLVATGRAEVMVDPRLGVWDAACFLPILREAGGSFTDWLGRDTAFGGNAIATNGALAKKARRLFAGAQSRRK